MLKLQQVKFKFKYIFNGNHTKQRGTIPTEVYMNQAKISANQFAVLAIGVLLVITALGNAKIMFAVSTVGMLLGMGFLRKDKDQSSVFAVTVGFFLAMIIAIMIWLKK
jgi:hypothetical protein